MAKAPFAMTPFGAHGLSVFNDKEAKVVYLAIPYGEADKAPISKSGKSRLVASTGGNQTVPDTGSLVIGLNAYVKAN